MAYTKEIDRKSFTHPPECHLLAFGRYLCFGKSISFMLFLADIGKKLYLCS